MKKRGTCLRCIKNPKTNYFNRLEPQMEARAKKQKHQCECHYKQAIINKKGGRYPKGTKF